MKPFFLLCLLSIGIKGTSQRILKPDAPYIKSVKLYRVGDQTSFPAISLGSGETMELHFDDLEGGVKNYYYSFQLCNADWTPSMLRPLEYLKGFQTIRISNYRNSSLTSVRYTHYQASVPDRTSVPTHSGNYLLRVFINSDTNNIVLSKRFVVVDNKAAVVTQLQQPYTAQYFKSHQKLAISVTTDNRTRIMSPQDLKVIALQNNNWQTAFWIDRPTIYRGNYYEYSDEAITAMPAAKEWRWIDLRSYRLLSDRMQRMDAKSDTTRVVVKPDATRNGQVYVYYRDFNGSYTMETLESVNPFWQADYAFVQFSYFPPNNKPIGGSDVYLFGELTNYGGDTSGKMIFNPERGAYEKTLLLKQGFYNYLYATLPQSGGAGFPDFSSTEGNYWGTENSYTLLVYYRPFGARADELIGFTSLNSVFHRQGL
ncbi:MAG TPA: DUF5103 domain-containing protein [Chitinophagaceae bacterium]|jgi:hypothetical protein|nr:DUF5103 domain-containing protein [Chitinophagaceae bacterium]